MSTFINYLNPSTTLESHLQKAFARLQIDEVRKSEIEAFLAVLKIKDLATWEHSVRVGLVASKIASFMHLNERALFYAGCLHDTGKAQTNPSTLKKTSGWTNEDTEEIRQHVMDGYRLVRGHFDFSAEIILWHHRFQPNSYPTENPPSLHDYSQGTKIMIPLFGRLLALADQYDALHRLNERFTAGRNEIGQWVRNQIGEQNPDQRSLVHELYEAHIFTEEIFEE